jgi:hypothetical protein
MPLRPPADGGLRHEAPEEMTHELIDAMSLRDGGTTYVSLRSPKEGVVSYWFDYSLPWDGRTRQIRKVEGKKSSMLAPASPEERVACQRVRSALVEQFGQSAVSQFESGRLPNPGKGRWFYAFNFLRLCVQEHKLDG